MRELNTLLLCRSQAVQLLLLQIYDTLGQATLFLPPFSSAINQPTKEMKTSHTYTAFSTLEKKKNDWEGTQNRNATAMSDCNSYKILF